MSLEVYWQWRTLFSRPSDAVALSLAVRTSKSSRGGVGSVAPPQKLSEIWTKLWLKGWQIKSLCAFEDLGGGGGGGGEGEQQKPF